MAILTVYPLSTRADDGVKNLSRSVKIAIVVCSIVAAASLGIIAWRIFVWRRRRGVTAATSMEIPNSANSIEKGVEAHMEYVQGNLDTAKPEEGSTRSPRMFPVSNQPPPYAYYTPSGTTLHPPPTSHPKVPPLNLVNNANCSAPLKSPARTAASSRPPLVKPQLSLAKPSDKRLPRLMTVATAYVPSLSDELPIKTGETVRMIEEYEDEWCLIQRVERPDDEKGVCPRLCLIERPEIIPRKSKGASMTFPVSTAALHVSTYAK